MSASSLAKSCYGELISDRYAMICCRPPFQAGSSTEIYEKAKSVDYQWPEDTQVRSRVPEEAKDLVAALLKPDPKDRLSLDDVVNHPFFDMHGGDCIPAILDRRCKEDKPDWLSTAEPRGDVMNAGAPRLKLRNLAESCGVGFDRSSGSFSVVGGDVDISLYKACLAEETAGACPQVPLPDDIVYFGKMSAEARSFIKETESPPVPSIPSNIRNKNRERLDTLPEDEQVDIIRPVSPRRSATHTANLLTTQPRSSASRASARTTSDSAAGDQPTQPEQRPATESASMRAPRGLMHERPLRMTRTLPRNTSRVTRSQKAGLTVDEAIPIYDEEAKIMSPRLTKDQIIDQLSPNPDEKRRELALRGKARIAANLQNELNALTHEDKKAPKATLPVRSRKAPAPKPIGWLVAPLEKVERLPNTTADDVCARLEVLRHGLSQAIRQADDNLHGSDPLVPNVGHEARQAPPLITKWVDYTNKLGVGYTFDNGSMGCLLKANTDYDNPQCGVLVAHTRAHYQKCRDPSYFAAAQLVPQTGAPVEFSEISEEVGVTRMVVPATRFKVTSRSEDGGARMRPSRDVHETEKRRRLGIWSRFAEYMVQNLAADSSSEAETPPGGRHTPGPFLRFYQRLGNVSIWAFVDGAFQINFPDHTKLVLHNDGKWIDFFCLTPAAMKRLKAGKLLNQQMLDMRMKLSYPPATLLKLSHNDETTGVSKNLKMAVQMNEVELKICFVRDVLAVWVQEGGMGKLGKNKYMKWDGFQAKKGLAWVSVGASGGDIYYKEPSVEE